MAQDLIFHGQFIDKTNLDGETGLTVTVDVYRTTISDGTTSQVVTDGSCSETGGGIYRYRLASADLSLYHYVANMKTASADVAQKHVAALGMVVPGVAADADGVPDVNVTQQGGVAVAAADGSGEILAVLGTSSAQTIADATKVKPAATPIAAIGSVAYILPTIPTDSDVQAAAAAALAAYGPSTAAELTSAVAPLALEATAQEILLDTGTTLPALLGGLSGATVTVVSSVEGGTITVYVADTWRFTVASDQLALADYETILLVVKRSARQADTQALLYLRSDTGLARMDGAAPASAANGVLTKAASSFTAVVHLAETQGLVPGSYTWWLKGLDTTPAPDEAVTLATGEFVVLAAGLQAVV